MCGIAGAISAQSLRDAELASVLAMSRSLIHRGPDGEGLFSSGTNPSCPANLMLAMRRLSIIDLTGGWQPLFNEDKSIAVVCNGEVYNHIELRESLRAKGHQFSTGSDCEMLVHLYEEHGLDFVHHLRGMYAFAMWDSRQRRLILGRDRMGEKPLYLFEEPATSTHPARIWFASELRSILASGRVPFELDRASVNLFYHYGYVPEPRTAVKGIRKLPAGSILVVELDSRSGVLEAHEHKYWRLDDAPPVEGNPAQLIRDELDRIGELIIRSDVPVGVALSGGIDSSLVAAIAAKHSPKQIQAISIGYKGRPRQDERHMAKRFAEHLRMPFHEVEVDTREVIDLMPQRAAWRDDPIADTASHGYWALSHKSRELNIPVLLQGQGGDELFWGYAWVAEAVRQSLSKSRNGAPSLLAGLSRLAPRTISRNALRGMVVSIAGLAQGWKRLMPERDAPSDQLIFYDLTEVYQMGAFAFRHIFTEAFRAEACAVDPAEPFRSPLPWKDLPVLITRLICDTYLLENGMAQGDRLSMTSSVELRLPLCDYKLAELVIGLRKSHAADPDYLLPPKTWLKDAAAEILPPWVMNRRKRGFTPPGDEWLPAMLEMHGPALLDGYLVSNRILDPAAARKMIESHPRFSAWEDIFFKSLTLELWARSMEELASKPDPKPIARLSEAPVLT